MPQLFPEQSLNCQTGVKSSTTYTHEQIMRYQATHKQVYGKEISFEEATRKAIIFYNLLSVVYTPLSETEFAEARSKVNAYREGMFTGEETCETASIESAPLN